jgi:hypothetical protein
VTDTSLGLSQLYTSEFVSFTQLVPDIRFKEYIFLFPPPVTSSSLSPVIALLEIAHAIPLVDGLL